MSSYLNALFVRIHVACRLV